MSIKHAKNEFKSGPKLLADTAVLPGSAQEPGKNFGLYYFYAMNNKSGLKIVCGAFLRFSFIS